MRKKFKLQIRRGLYRIVNSRQHRSGVKTSFGYQRKTNVATLPTAGSAGNRDRIEVSEQQRATEHTARYCSGDRAELALFRGLGYRVDAAQGPEAPGAEAVGTPPSSAPGAKTRCAERRGDPLSTPAARARPPRRAPSACRRSYEFQAAKCLPALAHIATTSARCCRPNERSPEGGEGTRRFV